MQNTDKSPLMEAYAKEANISYEEAIKQTIEFYKHLKKYFKNIGLTETTRGENK